MDSEGEGISEEKKTMQENTIAYYKRMAISKFHPISGAVLLSMLNTDIYPIRLISSQKYFSESLFVKSDLDSLMLFIIFASVEIRSLFPYAVSFSLR